MANNLVIVESPAKAKTIKKFLGNSYEVIASNGHVRDLPKSRMGIDIENDYEPQYITIRGKGELLATLRKAAKKADKIYLATDPDREGEAISYHLTEALKLDKKKYKRITFNEITKNAVKNSIKQARDIDMSLVDSQQARRVLDRMVGYTISPVLWEKIKRGLSAGRVQSVALKLICDREDEINSFIPEEYWSIDVNLKPNKNLKAVTFRYSKDKLTKNQVDEILNDIKDKVFEITDIKQSEKTKKQPLPFTTSTLQQEAGKKLNFATSKTMRIAQQLYEGVDIKGKGTIGLISYLRTDSTRISDEAQKSARDYISANFGEAYVGDGSGKTNGKKIQDAHEAIRPTDVNLTPAYLKDKLSREQFRLYQLIYNRFLASQMAPAVYETNTITASVGKHSFRASASKVKFEGFLAVYTPDDDKEENSKLSGIAVGDKLKSENVDAKQHFTQPPAHYTESLLVKAMEELGIGRPSTYAPTISIILNRRYVVKENKNLYVTELGEAVNQFMCQAFPAIVDTSFTANIETLLDNIEDGGLDWKVIIRNFYPDLAESVENAKKELENITIEDEVSDTACDLCGRMMVIKYGPHGKFLACPGFPECKNTKPHFEKIGVSCPVCGQDIVLRKSKKGRKYFSCISAPECDFMSWAKPTTVLCKECNSYMVDKGSKLMCSKDGCGYTCDKPKDM